MEGNISLPDTKQTEINATGKIKNGYMLIGFQGVPQEKRSDGYALDVLMTILGDGRSSKLHQSIIEQKQLAYSIYAGHSSMKDDIYAVFNTIGVILPDIKNEENLGE